MSGFGALRKIHAGFFVFGNSMFQHIIVPMKTSTLQPLTCHVVDFLNARLHLGYDTETLIRDMVCSESDEISKRCLNFTFYLFKQLQGTNSLKYNEGNVNDVFFKCPMKLYRTFNLVFG